MAAGLGLTLCKWVRIKTDRSVQTWWTQLQNRAKSCQGGPGWECPLLRLSGFWLWLKCMCQHSKPPEWWFLFGFPVSQPAKRVPLQTHASSSTQKEIPECFCLDSSLICRVWKAGKQGWSCVDAFSSWNQHEGLATRYRHLSSKGPWKQKLARAQSAMIGETKRGGPSVVEIHMSASHICNMNMSQVQEQEGTRKIHTGCTRAALTALALNVQKTARSAHSTMNLHAHVFFSAECIGNDALVPNPRSPDISNKLEFAHTKSVRNPRQVPADPKSSRIRGHFRPSHYRDHAASIVEQN